MSMIHSSFDLAHTLTKNDYFSDINPRSMRRFMNIVAVTGSLFCSFIVIYLHFKSNPLMNLQNFETIHSLMNYTKFD